MAEPDGPNVPDRETGGDGRRPRLWGIDPDRAAEWLTAVLSNLLFALPFAVVVLVLWKLLLEQLPGFNLEFFYPAVLLLLGGYALYAKDRHDTRTAVRRSLVHELVAAGESLPEDAPPTDPLPTDIYSANAGRLGRLSEPEVEAVVSFYTLAREANRGGADATTAERLRRRRAHAETVLREHLGEQVTGTEPLTVPERAPP